MDHYRFLFENIEKDKSDIIVALLSGLGFSGFEEDEKQLKAFISSNKFDENSFKKIIESLNVKYLQSVIKEINWNEKWESDFDPVVVIDESFDKPFAVVRASFHKPIPNANFEIIITPKMSFGTGHHATTYLMMQCMSRQSFFNKSVIDFGTGTGVLAILAEKMGAKKIVAIDNDDWSINNAKENIVENNCSKIILTQAQTIPPGIHAAIILANINLNVIKENISEIITACEQLSSVIFSGILIDDKENIFFGFK